MLKLVIKKVHVTCNICITYMYTNTNQVLAQNFEPFSAHVKARPWCSSGWSEEWAVIWKWGLWATCTMHTPFHVRPDALAAGSLCTISWPMQYLNNILDNTLVLQYPAQYLLCTIYNMLPNTQYASQYHSASQASKPERPHTFTIQSSARASLQKKEYT